MSKKSNGRSAHIFSELLHSRFTHDRKILGVINPADSTTVAEGYRVDIAETRLRVLLLVVHRHRSLNINEPFALDPSASSNSTLSVSSPLKLPISKYGKMIVPLADSAEFKF